MDRPVRSLDTGEAFSLEEINRGLHSAPLTHTRLPITTPSTRRGHHPWLDAIMPGWLRSGRQQLATVGPNVPGGGGTAPSPRVDETRAQTVARLTQKGLGFAQEAVRLDGLGDYIAAHAAYGRAGELLELALHVQRDQAVIDPETLNKYVALYGRRATRLRQRIDAGKRHCTAGVDSAAASVGSDGSPSAVDVDFDEIAGDQCVLHPQRSRRRASNIGTLRTLAFDETLGRLSVQRRQSDAEQMVLTAHNPLGSARGRRGRQYSRRTSHAESGLRFFMALREARAHLAMCEADLGCVCIWRFEPPCELASGLRGALEATSVGSTASMAEFASTDGTSSAASAVNAAMRIQGHVRVRLARREVWYLQTLCRLILLLDSRERAAARCIQSCWLRRRGAATTGGSSCKELHRSRLSQRRSSIGVDIDGTGSVALLTPRGDALLDLALDGGTPLAELPTPRAARTRASDIGGLAAAAAHAAATADDADAASGSAQSSHAAGGAADAAALITPRAPVRLWTPSDLGSCTPAIPPATPPTTGPRPFSILPRLRGVGSSSSDRLSPALRGMERAAGLSPPTGLEGLARSHDDGTLGGGSGADRSSADGSIRWSEESDLLRREFELLLEEEALLDEEEEAALAGRHTPSEPRSQRSAAELRCDATPLTTVDEDDEEASAIEGCGAFSTHMRSGVGAASALATTPTVLDSVRRDACLSVGSSVTASTPGSRGTSLIA